MFGPLGFPEIAFIIILALLIFGPKRLPELGRTLGRGLGEFRRASNELKRTFNAELSLDEDEERPTLSRRSLKPEEAPEPERPAPNLRPVEGAAVARSTGSSPAPQAEPANDAPISETPGEQTPGAETPKASTAGDEPAAGGDSSTAD